MMGKEFKSWSMRSLLGGVCIPKEILTEKEAKELVSKTKIPELFYPCFVHIKEDKIIKWSDFKFD